MSGNFLCCISHQHQKLLMHFLELLLYEGFTLESFLESVSWWVKRDDPNQERTLKRSMMMLQGQPQGCTCTGQSQLKSTFCQGRSPADSPHQCERGWFLHHPSWPRNTSGQLFYRYAPGNCASKNKGSCCAKTILELKQEYLGLSLLRKYLCWGNS